ncbi:hypothetical protein D3C85_983120 [compost metagenome]
MSIEAFVHICDYQFTQQNFFQAINHDGIGIRGPETSRMQFDQVNTRLSHGSTCPIEIEDWASSFGGIEKSTAVFPPCGCSFIRTIKNNVDWRQTAFNRKAVNAIPEIRQFDRGQGFRLHKQWRQRNSSVCRYLRRSGRRSCRTVSQVNNWKTEDNGRCIV